MTTLRILLLTRSLGFGGAERQLVTLARGLRRGGHHVAVAIFYGGGAFEEELRADGIPLHHLAKRGRWDTLPFLAKLARVVHAERPDVVHTSNGGNVFAAALKPLFPSVKVVWGLRSAMSDLSAYDWVMRAAPRLESLVSPLADAIVANSHAARRHAVATGMNGGKIVVIPNGIDCEHFRPDPDGGARVRAEWGVPPAARLVGMVARLDPVKNHRTFLRAAARVAAAREDVRFVCVGGGGAAYRDGLERLAAELRLGDRLVWAGERKVTRAVYGALDVAVLSSDSESFPNAVAEAMACGKPVVVTDAGDMPLIVADTGAVVPPRDPGALARGVLELLERTEAQGTTLPVRARARIEGEFSVPLLVQRTERALRRVVGGESGRA
jgi:glycosyltransferase involved in cell wall biosynthesis